ncbi:MAG: hypothetical protein ACRDYF_08535 [Acidimicrobiia bacterium]
MPFGINSLSNVSEAIVIGKVVTVGEPRWNSKDGHEWCPPNSETPQLSTATSLSK